MHISRHTYRKTKLLSAVLLTVLFNSEYCFADSGRSSNNKIILPDLSETVSISFYPANQSTSPAASDFTPITLKIPRHYLYQWYNYTDGIETGIHIAFDWKQLSDNIYDFQPLVDHRGRMQRLNIGQNGFLVQVTTLPNFPPLHTATDFLKKAKSTGISLPTYNDGHILVWNEKTDFFFRRDNYCGYDVFEHSLKKSTTYLTPSRNNSRNEELRPTTIGRIFAYDDGGNYRDYTHIIDCDFGINDSPGICSTVAMMQSFLYARFYFNETQICDASQLLESGMAFLNSLKSSAEE